MAAKTPAQWKTLFENVPFHRENYYTGPLGPDYTPGGTCLRLWAPTAEAVTVTLYHKGDGGAVLGTEPLVRGAHGVWSIWLPGEQHGRYYTFAVTVNGITRETGDPYARAVGVNGVRSMIVDLARTAPSGWERDVRPAIPPAQRAGFDGEENITGTSDALNTDAIMNLIVAANPGIDTIGLLYDLSQDASTQAIADAKAFCEKNGIKVVEKNGTTTAEVQMAAEALVAAGVKAVFTPTDNTIMTAELSIYESFIEAGVQHYTGADSFALNGALVGYGVDYVQLGEATADMVSQLLCDGKTPADLPYQTFDNGIVTINTETAEALGLDLAALKEAFKPYCTEICEVTTAENFS